MSNRYWLGAVMLVTWLGVVIAQAADDATVALKNGSFESPAITAGAKELDKPDDWLYFSSQAQEVTGGITKEKAKVGDQSLKLKCQATVDSFLGAVQRFEIKPLYHYAFSVYVINSPTDPLVKGAFGQISLEWKDAAGREISRSWGPTWDTTLSPTKWEQFLVEGDAPESAFFCDGAITLQCKDSGGAGACYVDKCEVIARPPAK